MRRRTTGVGLALAGLVLTALTGAPGTSAAAERPTYTNPVSKPFADTFADPSVIRGKDGWWYAYGTSDPLREGEGTVHRIPMARSANLVDWTSVGDAFTAATLPSWAADGASMWAPDIRYVDGEYRMYYVVTETTVTDRGGDNAIGMATAPSPTGPWTDSGAPVVAPREGNGGFLWTFDPSVVTDGDGSQWIFYGSYNGGVFIAPLDARGRRTTGPARMVAVDNKFEGAYVVRHGGYWFLFASTANCCAGPATGYSVQVGRSKDLRGPYVDAQGVPLTASRAGGTPVLNQNGNTWIGAGHNAIARDVAGQDWIVYHAIDRKDPYLDGTSGINQRPMLIDRLDWIQGWPAVRAGRGPSEAPQPAPVTAARGADRPAPTASVSALPSRGPVRVEADVRGRAHLVATWPGHRKAVTASVLPRSHRLVLAAVSGRSRSVRSVAVPASVDLSTLHSLALVVGPRKARAQLTHARLGDPLGTLTIRLPRGLRAGPDRAGAIASAPGSAAVNLTAVRPAVPVRHAVADSVPSRLDPAASDEFHGSTISSAWSWVRPDSAATVGSGVLRWPTEAADLTGTSNDAGVLLRDAPTGDWTVATKVTIDLGTDTVRNYQQAGLIAYVGDDEFTRLSHVAIWNTRQTEFLKEMTYAGAPAFGGTIVGPPAETTYLRLTHHLDPVNGEHELRAWTSRDGSSWVRGGVWTLPAGARLRVGLISHGGAGATAQFDWFRTYR